MKKGPITATFIDEITYDIPSSNWSQKNWKNDLDNMKSIGIDTIVLIRGGFEDKTIFPSRVIGTAGTPDFAGFILEEAEKRDMAVFFGLYVTNLEWNCGDWISEIKTNKAFIDEIWERYGDCPAFKGWYIPQECERERLNFSEILRGLSALCKDKAPDKKVLISPFFYTPITADNGGFSPRQTYEEWDKLFSYGGNDIDICAFQDGTVALRDMREYFTATKAVCEKHGIEHWVNLELFERDVRSMYYPIPFTQLVPKLELHKEYAEKILCFEYSHFLSSQSIFPSARNLNKLYCEKYL